jgi:transcriptional regulator with XRE-family HTH domain
MASTTGIKKQQMTEKDVIDLIREAQGDRSLRVFAEEVGVSAAYISDVFTGRRRPGEKILKHFKVGKTRRIIVKYDFFKIN